MKAHEAAALFPLMVGDDLQSLAGDIRERGLLDAVVLLDGEILDGRNRYAACEIAGVEPRFVEADLGDLTPVEYVVSHNLHRRHLTTGQRAALALDLLPALEEKARERSLANLKRGTESPERPETDGRADEKAAAMVGIGRSTVATAKRIQKLDESGEVVERMRSGELNLRQAQSAAGIASPPGVGSGVGAVDNGNRLDDGRSRPIFFGKGDKWSEATEPLRRYLAARAKRDYLYSDIAPREAKKRVALINELMAGLSASLADLEQRTTVYRLTA